MNSEALTKIGSRWCFCDLSSERKEPSRGSLTRRHCNSFIAFIFDFRYVPLLLLLITSFLFTPACGSFLGGLPHNLWLFRTHRDKRKDGHRPCLPCHHHLQRCQFFQECHAQAGGLDEWCVCPRHSWILSIAPPVLSLQAHRQSVLSTVANTMQTPPPLLLLLPKCDFAPTVQLRSATSTRLPSLLLAMPSPSGVSSTRS